MHRQLLFASLTLGLSSIAAAQSPSYSQLVVFGDSLSDTGNFFAATGNPPAPYWQGRFSNGPIWAEQLANHIGLYTNNTINKAVGFATTTDVLHLQIQPYLVGAGSADPAALYSYWAGANDLFGLLSTPGADPAVVIGTAMQNTATSLQALLAAGAQHIVVANLPDLSVTPFAVEFGDPALTAMMFALTRTYNRYLAYTLDAVEAASGVPITRFDAFGLTRSLVQDPFSGGFRNVDQRAFSSTGVLTPYPDAYMFWDHVHPTTKGHSFVMGTALAQLGILWGDVHVDGVLDINDANALLQVMGPSVPGTAADLDGSGVVDNQDHDLLMILLR